MSCVGKVYKSKKWAKRFGKGRKITPVKGGFKIGKKVKKSHRTKKRKKKFSLFSLI